VYFCFLTKTETYESDFKTNFFLFFLSLIFLSCSEDSNDSFQIEIFNPYSFDIEINSNVIVSEVIESYATRTLIGDAGTGSLYAKESGCVDSCLILGEQGSFSGGNREFDFEAGKSFSWTAGENNIYETGTDSSIVGKWINLNGCVTASGDQSFFLFNSDGTGSIFNADCNNSCTNYGYFLNFEWEDNGSSVLLNYTSVSEYCGVQVATPLPETINYSISGVNLSLGGATWTKS
jgi:hypothetical protein